MNAPDAPPPPAPRVSIWELLAPALLLAWRIRAHPLSLLWRDWVTLLCVLWIVRIVAGRSRAWPYVLTATMAGLLALYTAGQLPLTLGLLGIGR